MSRAMERMNNVADKLSDEWNLDGITVEQQAQATVTAVYRHASGVRIAWSANPGHSVQLIDADGSTESWEQNGGIESASHAVQTCVELVDNGLLTDMPPQTENPQL